ncbi:hypothetical protein GCM10010412_015950 [Nonomuraea recticatena]|uniref:Uncharacterized protein n=1 Tax=Nonomuraea recticatena TaxID=46178 RepID=A0ABP6DQC8_9ACTN
MEQRQAGDRGGLVDDRVRLPAVERGQQRLAVHHVRHHRYGARLGEPPGAAGGPRESQHRMTGGEQVADQDRTQRAGGPREQDVHALAPSLAFLRM